MMIDAHVHLWDTARVSYPWMSAFPDINPQRTWSEIDGPAAAVGIEGVLLVQAADSVEETRLLIEYADAWERVRGVVGWAPLRDSRALGRTLAEYERSPVVGIRHQLYNEPDPEWLVSPETIAGLAHVRDAGLSFDLLASNPRHLSAVPVLARALPDLHIVIDHGGGLPTDRQEFEAWADLISDAARLSSVSVKISGALLERYPASQFAQFAIDLLGSVLAPEQMLPGSDWPLTHPDQYENTWTTILLLSERSPFAELARSLSTEAAYPRLAAQRRKVTD